MMERGAYGAPGYSLHFTSTAGFYIQNDIYTNACTGTSGPTDINDGNWHYVVGERDPGNLYLYVDGVLVSSTPESVGSISQSLPTYLASYNQQGNWLNGEIDEARISNTALSASWIPTEYNNQSSPSTFYAMVLAPEDLIR